MRTAAILALAASALGGADVTGIWVGQFPGRNGEPQDIAFKLEQKGESLRGKLYGDYTSWPVSEGKISGDEVSFAVVISEQSGNQINTTKLRFSGRIEGTRLELVRERERSTNAGNAGGAPPRTDAKVNVSLKRLL
jgi:hypothetical protein